MFGGGTTTCMYIVATLLFESAVVDRHLDAAIGGGRRGERVAVDHLAQRGLIVGERRRAAEREDAGDLTVARCRDAARQRAGDGEHVARVPRPSEYRDRRRLDRRAVGIGDQDVDVGDRYRRSAGRVCRRGVRSATGGIVGVEIEPGGAAVRFVRYIDESRAVLDSRPGRRRPRPGYASDCSEHRWC